jgi:nucleoside-diphosphate-sugar epimerase
MGGPEAETHHPGDLRDISMIRRAVQGMDAVVHLGAIPHDRSGTPEDIYEVNVQGTWNLLLACEEAGIKRLVNFSSINALGCVGGHRKPSRFPVDDSFPPVPMTPYQISKHVAEELCTAYANRTGMSIASLRPGAVMDPRRYNMWQRWSGSGSEMAARELWVYVDARDVADAVVRALTAEIKGHQGFLLLAKETHSDTPTMELIQAHYPDVPWVGTTPEEYFAGNPLRAPLDCHAAEEILGWRAQHTWREYVNEAS